MKNQSSSSSFFQSKRFIALLAALTGLTALGIDAVLPLFPDIIHYFSLNPEDHNRVQQVVFVYMLGFSICQLLFGILADMFGRKVLLLFGVLVFSLASLSVLLSSQFESLLVQRFIQGAGLAAPRVLTMTIVRDVVSGRAMSRIMSFVTMVFLAIPAIAPMIGQLMIVFFPWQSVFVLLALTGCVLMAWVWRDLPETLAPAYRRAPRFSELKAAVLQFMQNVETVCYLVMITLFFAGLMVYIGQAEQILQKDIYALGAHFPLAFSAIVLGMVAAAIVNARIVMRLGMRKILFIAMILLLFADAALALCVLVGGGFVPLWLFILLLMFHFFGFGLAMPNLNALILEPYQQIAGTASALVGTITSVCGVFLAFCISHFYRENLYALAFGFVGTAALAWVFYVQTYRHRND